MLYNSIILEHFLSYTGLLFGYDKNVTYQYAEYKFQDTDSYLDHKTLIDLNFIQNKFLEYIKNYIHLNRGPLIGLINKFRALNRRFYNNQIVDNDYRNILGIYGYNFVPLQTSPDGYCLFNAVSMFRCGNEEENYNLKFASVFTIVEYENLFRTFIINKGFNFSYDSFVSNTAIVSKFLKLIFELNKILQ